MLQSFVNSVVFVPPRDPNSLQHVQLLQHRQYMRFTTKRSGERLSYFHFDPTGNTMTDAMLEQIKDTAMVVLYNHGNAEDLGGAFAYAQSVAVAFKAAVIVYDYCGYGLSGYPDTTRVAEVTEKSVYGDADHIYAHLLSLGYPAHHIVIVGRSVGGGPACYLAEKHHAEVAGLVLISTFTSCLRVVRSCCCLPYLCCCVDLFPNYRRLVGTTDCPVLVMHGDADNVVPCACSVELLHAIESDRNAAWQRLERSRRRAQERGSTARKSSSVKGASSAHSARDGPLGGPSHSPANGEALSVFELYARAFEALSIPNRTRAEEQLHVRADSVRIGAFHWWFAGCGHNDIEARKGHEFCSVFDWFLAFCKAFARERAALLPTVPPMSVASTSDVAESMVNNAPARGE